MDMFAQLLSELQKLQGLECWGVVAGEGTGSHVTLDFGRRIERARPLKNPKLPESQRQFKGEFGIFIQNCAWRLDTNSVVCSSKSSNDNEGVMVRGLHALIGQHAVNATASLPAHDLTIEFSRTTRLRLFCDCYDQNEDGDNYSFHAPDQVFTANAGGLLTLDSKRKP